MKDLNTDALFNFAGMDTNRTDAVPSATNANPGQFSFDAPVQQQQQQPEGQSDPAAAQGNNNDAFSAFM